MIPLGLPTLAGPGAITTVITLTAQAATPVRRASVFVAIVLVLAVSWAVLAMAPAMLRRLGHTGLNVLTRIMGLIIMVIGVQFVLDGVRAFVASLTRG